MIPKNVNPTQKGGYKNYFSKEINELAVIYG